MLGKKQAVNEQPQFAVGKIPFKVEIRPQIAFLRHAGFGIRHHTDRFAVLNVIAAVHKVQNVPPDRLAVGSHVVFGFQDFGNILLAQTMILVGILS